MLLHAWGEFWRSFDRLISALRHSTLWPLTFVDMVRLTNPGTHTHFMTLSGMWSHCWMRWG